MSMPGRKYEAQSGYRYGFNGKEKENGNNQYDFGERLYDGKIGRWISVDRNSSNYPSIVPFAFSINNPLRFIDPNGRWVVEVIQNSNKKYELRFVAEKDDNLEILATQLGLSKETLLKADPSLEKLEISTCTSIDLQKLDIVQSINKAINDVEQTWNCANFAYAASSSKNLEIQFAEGATSSNLDAMDRKLKNNYESVSDENAQIGSVIRYDLIENAEAKYALALIQERVQEYKEMGLTDKETLLLLNSIKSDAKTTVQNEKHYAIVLLKTKDGTQIMSIMQKQGKSTFKYYPEPELNATNNGLDYKPEPVKKTPNPIYTNKSQVEPASSNSSEPVKSN